MLKNYRCCVTLLLVAGLTACASAPGGMSQRTEHHYAFGKPKAADVMPPSSTVAPVVVERQQGKKGPAGAAHVVYFDFDSYVVRKSDYGTLETHASWMRDRPGQSVVLQGHTDARGSVEYNLALGQKRAEAVRQSLQLMGVEHRQIEAVSYGMERPADMGASEAAHQRNRRVEFEYR